MEGQIEHAETEGDHLIAAHSIDCSPGQDGGPLTLKDGTIVGVYSNVEEYGDSNYYMVSAINDKFISWFDKNFPGGVEGVDPTQISSLAQPPVMAGPPVMVGA